MPYEPWILYLLFGCLAGVLSGLFGIGGGAVLVPFLLWQFEASGFPADLVMIMAVATSLATIIVTSCISAYAHHRRGAVDWRAAFALAPGVLLGSVAGSVVADQLPVRILKLIFAVFLLVVALRLASGDQTGETRPWKGSQRLLVFAGTHIGAISAIVGIGGGSLIVPLLVKCRFPMRKAVATSSACGFPIALAGTVSYIYLGWAKPQLPADSLGYLYLPAFVGIVAASMLCAPLGARLAHQLPTVGLKWLFALILFLIGLKLLWQTF
jgi:uncharacterized protein